jgi:hypothetical protein
MGEQRTECATSPRLFLLTDTFWACNEGLKLLFFIDEVRP